MWVSLGEFYLEPGGDNYVYLTNKTTTDSNLGLWYDAIRLRPQPISPPTVTIQQPATDTWLTNRSVNFSWDVTNSANVQRIDLEVATNAAFTNLVMTQTLSAQATTATYTFTQDYHDLYWRVTVYPLTGGAVVSTTGHFGLDAAAPTSTVTAIYILAPTQPVTVTNYLIHWLGDDATSGIASYTVDYRPDGAATWTRWLTNTTSTANNFAPPEPGTVYWFRVQATDVAGNSETTHPDGDINTSRAAVLRAWLPVGWAVSSASGV